MTSASSKRWTRRELPWRSTLGGVVVAGPHGVLVLEGAAARVWRLLGDPTTSAELAAGFAAAGATDELEDSDPLGRLIEHDVIAEVP